MCKKITIMQLRCDDAPALIFYMQYQRYLVTAAMDVVDNLCALSNWKHEIKESFFNYKSSFIAQMAKYNAHSRCLQLLKYVYTLVFPLNAIIYHSQQKSQYYNL